MRIALLLIIPIVIAGCGKGSNAVYCDGGVKEIREHYGYGGRETLVVCKDGEVKQLHN